MYHQWSVLGGTQTCMQTVTGVLDVVFCLINRIRNVVLLVIDCNSFLLFLDRYSCSDIKTAPTISNWSIQTSDSCNLVSSIIVYSNYIILNRLLVLIISDHIGVQFVEMSANPTVGLLVQAEGLAGKLTGQCQRSALGWQCYHQRHSTGPASSARESRKEKENNRWHLVKAKSMCQRLSVLLWAVIWLWLKVLRVLRMRSSRVWNNNLPLSLWAKISVIFSVSK